MNARNVWAMCSAKRRAFKSRLKLSGMAYTPCQATFIIMTEQNIKRMWDIDHKAQLGDKITDEERDFFNAHYELMREEMENNWTHWQFHSGRL